MFRVVECDLTLTLALALTLPLTLTRRVVWWWYESGGMGALSPHLYCRHRLGQREVGAALALGERLQSYVDMCVCVCVCVCV